MESKSYEFDGELIILTEDEISALNKTNEVGALGSDVAVILKDENIVHGTIVVFLQNSRSQYQICQ